MLKRNIYIFPFKYKHIYCSRFFLRFKTTSPVSDKMTHWMQWYEDTIGLTEVKEAQNHVIMAEQGFSKSQDARREHNHLLINLQARLREIDYELDKIPRGDDRFLDLIKDQHALVRQETSLKDKHDALEKEERVSFIELSNAVRDSHEKERQRAERTKYWSVIGSIIGALLGICGATINNYFRNREIKNLGETVRTQKGDIQSILIDFKSKIGTLGTATDDIKILKFDEEKSKEILEAIKVSDESMEKQITDVKKLVISGGKPNSESDIVYVGPQIEGMLSTTEKNLEYKLKINSLATVAFVYGAFAISVPILYAIFRGDA